MASQITSLTIVYSTFCSGPDQRKHQSSASLAFVEGIHRWPVNSPHKGPVTRKMFPFDDVILLCRIWYIQIHKTRGHNVYLQIFSKTCYTTRTNDDQMASPYIQLFIWSFSCVISNDQILSTLPIIHCNTPVCYLEWNVYVIWNEMFHQNLITKTYRKLHVVFWFCWMNSTHAAQGVYFAYIIARSRYKEVNIIQNDS